jgi:hypothetical protein
MRETSEKVPTINWVLHPFSRDDPAAPNPLFDINVDLRYIYEGISHKCGLGAELSVSCFCVSLLLSGYIKLSKCKKWKTRFL